MNSYQNRLLKLLEQSPITMGKYTPSNDFKSISHTALFAGDHLVYVSGPDGDEESIRIATELSKCRIYIDALIKLGYREKLRTGTVSGDYFGHGFSYNAILGSTPGKREYNGYDSCTCYGLNLTTSDGLSVLMCVNTEIVEILCGSKYELDDGIELSLLATTASARDRLKRKILNGV